MIASMPDAVLERKAPTEDAAARNSAVNRTVAPIGGRRVSRENPSTWASRVRPLPWMKKSMPNEISAMGTMRTSNGDSTFNPIKALMPL